MVLQEDVKKEKEAPWRGIPAYLFIAAFSLALFLPLLGAQGLWDPWETHYSEVARRIVEDGDWITLRWHDELFFSKPIFLFWTIAASFKIFGVSEWAARFPIVLFSMAGLLAVFYYLRRMFGFWQGLAASVCLATMPLWVMISRQAMTDMEFVVSMSVGILALTHYLSNGKASRLHAYFAYFCFGISTLAKGLLGFALPGAIFFILIVLSGRWDILKRARLPEGAGIFSAVVLPWYGAVSVLHGKTFLYEFFFLHHIARAGGGVHGQRGAFEYFIPHVGWGILPWIIVVLPPVIFFFMEIRRCTRSDEPSGLLKNLMIVAWAACTFSLFTITRTKFHHYIFPMIIPLSIMIAVWGVQKVRHGVLGWEKILIMTGCLMSILLAREIVFEPDRITFLFTYAYERPTGSPSATAAAAILSLFVFSAGVVIFVFVNSFPAKRAAVALSFLSSVFFSLYLVHWHMPATSPHVSQKESFNLWNELQKTQDKFYNWKMNWRGEIYYSKDTIPKVSRLEQLRPVLAKPGRYFIISTIERYKQLDMEIERIRGKKLEKYNPHDSRYGFGMYDGPVLKPIPSPPLVRQVPAGASKISASMGDGLLELAGYEVGARSAKIGDSFFITLYWKPIKKVKERWIVFIHGERYYKGEAKRFNGNHVTGEGLYPTEKWRPGTIIKDQFAVCVDYGIPTGRYILKAGLYREKERLDVDQQWMHDGHNRIPIGEIRIEN